MLRVDDAEKSNTRYEERTGVRRGEERAGNMEESKPRIEMKRMKELKRERGMDTVVMIL